MRRAIEMRPERHSFLSDLAQFIEAENLKAARVSQNRRGQAMKRCSPPKLPTCSTPGRRYRW